MFYYSSVEFLFHLHQNLSNPRVPDDYYANLNSTQRLELIAHLVRNDTFYNLALTYAKSDYLSDAERRAVFYLF